jgi:hypothetical protein
MKTKSLILLAAATGLTLAACGKKETTVREKVSDRVGDALNTRDHEKLRDATEDLEKDAKKAGEGIGEALKDVGDKIKEDADKVKEDLR